MTVYIRRNQYSGTSKVFGQEQDALANTIRSIVRYQARQSIVGTPSLTDNIGGLAPSTTLSVVPLVPATTPVGSDSVTKADAEAAFATAVSALASVVGQIEVIRGKVPVFDSAYINLLGTVSSTLGPITTAFVGNNASLALAAGVNGVLSLLRQAITQAAYHVTLVAVATGTGTSPFYGLTGSAMPVSQATYVPVFAALPVTTGAVATGVADAVTAVNLTASMVVVAQDIRDLALVLNNVLANTAVPLVVAI